MGERLARHERRKEGVPFLMTARDLELLRALNRYRLLKTSQVRRLLFAATFDLQVARRRLKLLYQNGYVERVTPLLLPGKGSAEEVYELARAGEEVLQSLGDEVVSFASDEVKRLFVEHTLAVSEFRLKLELGLRGHPVVELERFTPDCELKRQLRRGGVHPLRGEGLVLFPDAVIILRGKGELAAERGLYFLEVDMGSESLKVLQEKAAAYDLYRRRRMQRGFGDFGTFRVLLETASRQRAENIRRSLAGSAGEELVWVAETSQVNERAILGEPIWVDSQGNRRPLVKRELTQPGEPAAARTGPEGRGTGQETAC